VPLVTQAEYARHRGVSRQAVGKAVKAGRVELLNGLVDVEAADSRWTAGTRAQVEAVPFDKGRESTRTARPDDGLPSYLTSRAIREAYVARLARLDFEERNGNLVPMARVTIAFFNVSRRARDLLLALEDKLAPLMLHLEDEGRARLLIRAEVDHVLDELARGSGLLVTPDVDTGVDGPARVGGA